MTPTQHRTLERLAAAARGYGPGPWPGLLIAHGPQVPPGRVHPRTADALVRRNLARRAPLDRGEELLEITEDGLGLLARRPDPIDATR